MYLLVNHVITHNMIYKNTLKVVHIVPDFKFYLRTEQSCIKYHIEL